MLSPESLTKLSHQQTKLDDNIMAKRHLTPNDTIFQKRLIAFLVELGEFANEERSFKYWSNKAPSDKDTQLDEYVDGLHFLLSLGNSINFNFAHFQMENANSKCGKSEKDYALGNIYLEIVNYLEIFSQTKTPIAFANLFAEFLCLGQACGFDEADIMEAYDKKNAINFERQEQNY